MSQYSGRVIESQPDWLTVSAHGEGPAKALLDLAVGLAKEEEQHGAKPRKWRSLGYEGTHTGRIEYGQRDVRATELRLSGDAASIYLDPTVHRAHNVTRLDLAVTWQSDVDVPDFGLEQYEQAFAFWRKNPRKAAPWSVSDATGGFTLYIGDRGSEYFYRCYNKERQARKQMGKKYDGHYNRCWRFELETKASIPRQVLDKLMPAEDRAAWVQGYVHSYMETHGLTPPFESAGGQELVPGFRRFSDADSKLNWIAKSVAPAVDFLLAQGRRDDLLKALRLEDSNQTLTTLGPRPRLTSSIMGGSARGKQPTEGDSTSD